MYIPPLKVLNQCICCWRTSTFLLVKYCIEVSNIVSEKRPSCYLLKSCHLLARQYTLIFDISLRVLYNHLTFISDVFGHFQTFSDSNQGLKCLKMSKAFEMKYIKVEYLPELRSFRASCFVVSSILQ